MGIRNGTELGRSRVLTAHTGTGASTTFWPETDARSAHAGQFNATVAGTFVGTVVVQKSFDGGTTWYQAYDTKGDAVSFTAPGAAVLAEHEKGVGYRFNCSAFTSGTINTRLSQ